MNNFLEIGDVKIPSIALESKNRVISEKILLTVFAISLTAFVSTVIVHYNIKRISELENWN